MAHFAVKSLTFDSDQRKKRPGNMKLIDSHCHIDDDRLDVTREQVLRRAAEQGVDQIIVPATTAARWHKIRTLSQQNARLLPAYGLHPMFIEQHQREHLQQLETWIQQESPVAVGECGLDFFEGSETEAWQTELFIGQIDIANRYNLPLIIHARKSLDKVISQLRRHPHHGGVIHSFAGSEQQARQLIEMNFCLGIAATVSFERARRLRQVVSSVPMESLLIESDAPDQSGPLHRGELNEPGFIADHLASIAELRQLDVEATALQLNRNCERLFALSKTAD